MFSNDGKNTPIYLRQVTDADLANWKFANMDLVSELPSRFQIGDMVSLNFESSGVIRNARVLKIHFTEGKVLYDVEIRVENFDEEGKGSSYTTRLYNIDSIFLNAD